MTTITLGTTTIEASETSQDQGYINGFLVTLDQTATLKSLSIYIKANPNSGHVMMAWYVDNDGAMGALKAASASIVVIAGAWNELTVTDIECAAGNYWIVFQNDDSSIATASSDAAGTMHYVAQSYGSFPNPGGAFSNTYLATYSMYATLETSGGTGDTIIGRAIVGTVSKPVVHAQTTITTKALAAIVEHAQISMVAEIIAAKANSSVLGMVTPKAAVSHTGKSIIATSATGRVGNPAWPIKCDPTNRFLLQQNNVPYFIEGDAPWKLIKISPTDQNLLFTALQSHGVNTILFEIITHDTNVTQGGTLTCDYAGHEPFAGTFLQSSLGVSYWAYVDETLARLASYGIIAVCFPMYLGYDGGDEGMYDESQAATVAQIETYGTAIANRYKDIPNIIWCMGGDYTPPDKSRTNALAAAILAVDANHLMTSHQSPGDTSIEAWGAADWLSLDSVYAYGNMYSEAQQEYDRASPLPVVYMEGHYQTTVSAQLYRQSQWEPVLSGAICGSFGGHALIWAFLDANNWRDHLDDVGYHHSKVFGDFFRARATHKLIPDIDNTFLTAGYSIGDARASASIASDGSWGAIYVPDSRSMTVALDGFSTNVRVFWFDPIDTTTVNVYASHAPSGLITISATPGTNSAGDSDWVLVFEIVTGESVVARSCAAFVAHFAALSSVSHLVKSNAANYDRGIPKALTTIIGHSTATTDVNGQPLSSVVLSVRENASFNGAAGIPNSAVIRMANAQTSVKSIALPRASVLINGRSIVVTEAKGLLQAVIERILLGLSDGVSVVSGALTLIRNINATITTATSVTAATEVNWALRTTIAGVTTVTANLDTDVPIIGTSNANSDVSGDLNMLRPLAGQVNGLSVVDADLLNMIWQDGQADGVTSISASLHVRYDLNVISNGQSSLFGMLPAEKVLVASSIGLSNLAGVLTVIEVGIDISLDPTLSRGRSRVRGKISIVRFVSGFSVKDNPRIITRIFL